MLKETKGYTIEEVSRLFDGQEHADHMVAEAQVGKAGLAGQDKRVEEFVEKATELK